MTGDDERLSAVYGDPPRAGAPAGTRERSGVPFAELTTIGLGGPARRLVEAWEEAEVVEAVAAADRAGEPLLVLGGGSNLVVSDAGFDGAVVRVLTRGVTATRSPGGVRLEVAAGEPWDGLVARCVAEDLAGVECLSGIPGSAGATPIQNVGAYGQEVASTIVSVRTYDRAAGAVVELSNRECEFAYRASVLRGCARHVVLAVSFALERSSTASSLRYRELVAALAGRESLAAVREAVLALRRGKGMVIDPADPSSRSAGSFFVNPLLSAEAFAALQSRAAERLGGDVHPPAWPEPDGRVKTSAAWLIDHAGFHRGYGAGRVGVSEKHALALVNRGDATTAELLELAREMRDGVREAFGVGLHPEPTFVGVRL